MTGSSWCDRRGNEQAWCKIDFCRLCWRLCAAGGSTSRRRPLCDHHKPRTKEYQKHERLKERFPDSIREVKQAFRNAGGYKTTLKTKIPDNILKALPCVSLYAREAGVDPQSLPNLLDLLMLEGLEDPEGKRKIKAEVDKWKDGGEWVLGTLTYAEAWLSLIYKTKHGGRRPGSGRKKQQVDT